MEEKEHLFSKNISDHSVRALKELCEGVGISFAVVGKNPPCELPTGSAEGTVCAKGFTS
jgi:hypothetical protein